MKNTTVTLNIDDVEMQFTVTQLRYDKLINEISAANATDALRKFVKSCADDKQKVDQLNVAQINRIYEMLADAAAPMAMYEVEKNDENITLTVTEEDETESGIDEKVTVVGFAINYERFEKFQNRSGQSNKVLAIKNLLLDTAIEEHKNALRTLIKTHPINDLASPVIQQMGDAGKISLVA